MHSVIATIQAGLSYAKFSNPDIRKRTMALLNALGEDITTEDYEPGSQVETLDTQLNQALDDLDKQREELFDSIDNAEGVIDIDVDVDEEDEDDDVEYIDPHKKVT